MTRNAFAHGTRELDARSAIRPERLRPTEPTRRLSGRPRLRAAPSAPEDTAKACSMRAGSGPSEHGRGGWDGSEARRRRSSARIREAARREARVRAQYPRTARLRLALARAPQHETAWELGAIGEELVADSLERRCGDRCRILHDRKMPGSRANIDHIAIAPSGVWVIDAKNYKGKIRVDVTRKHGERLFIGRRNQKLVDGLDTVRSLRSGRRWASSSRGPVSAFCFIDTDMPLFRRLSVRGYPLRWRKGMAKLLRDDGPVLPEQIAFLSRELALRFRQA